jgi:hypothetical protein
MLRIRAVSRARAGARSCALITNGGGLRVAALLSSMGDSGTLSSGLLSLSLVTRAQSVTLCVS